MKVVVNKCYGGFGISLTALKELVIRGAGCIKKFTPSDYYGKTRPDIDMQWEKDFAKYLDIGDGFFGHPDNFNIFKDGVLYDIEDRGNESARGDKDLVEVVEKLQDAANGRFAKLEVVELPDGIKWEIQEYDGIESIHEIHRSW